MSKIIKYYFTQPVTLWNKFTPHLLIGSRLDRTFIPSGCCLTSTKPMFKKLSVLFSSFSFVPVVSYTRVSSLNLGSTVFRTVLPPWRLSLASLDRRKLPRKGLGLWAMGLKLAVSQSARVDHSRWNTLEKTVFLGWNTKDKKHKSRNYKKIQGSSRQTLISSDFFQVALSCQPHQI